MQFFKKLTGLIGGQAASVDKEIAVEPSEITPQSLDKPPYTFANALQAARVGDVAKIQSYLDFNQNYALCKNWEDFTLLHQAAKSIRPAIIKLLLTAGAEVNAVYKGQSPLHLAIEGDPVEMTTLDANQLLDYRKRRRETVQLLLQHKANLEQADEAGEQPLHVAAKLGHSELVELLLSNGAKVDTAIESADSKKASNIGRTPLLLAVRYNKDLKTIKLLLDKGANPNVKDSDPGYAPLHYIAAFHGTNSKIKESHLRELLLLFLNYQVDINATTDDKLKQTPLYLAVLYQHFDLIDILLSKGADINAKDTQGYTVLSYAAGQGDMKMTAYVLDRGGNIETSRALFHAAGCVTTDATLRLLLDRGADVNMVDNKGFTPLFAAISAHSLHNVKLLIERKADTKLYSPKGLTLLEHAFACWGEVENVQRNDLSEEEKRLATAARDIIELLGGFAKRERRMLGT